MAWVAWFGVPRPAAPQRAPSAGRSAASKLLLLLLCPQVAANTKGIALVKDLIREYGLLVVQAYMQHIQVGEGPENAWWLGLGG